MGNRKQKRKSTKKPHLSANGRAASKRAKQDVVHMMVLTSLESKKEVMFVGTSDILNYALFSNQYYNRKKIYQKFIHVKDMPYHVSRITTGLSGSGEIWGIARIASGNHFNRII